VNKRDMAKNNAFFCDMCDRGFKTEEKYNEHTAQHKKVCLMLTCVHACERMCLSVCVFVSAVITIIVITIFIAIF